MSLFGGLSEMQTSNWQGQWNSYEHMQLVRVTLLRG